MKKIAQLLLVVFTVSTVTVSCSKDDDGPSNDISNDIKGKYETTYEKHSGPGDDESNYEYKTVEEIKDADHYMQLDFKTDKTVWFSDDDEGWKESEMKWKQDGNSIKIKENGEDKYEDWAKVDNGVIKAESEHGDYKYIAHYSKL